MTEVSGDRTPTPDGSAADAWERLDRRYPPRRMRRRTGLILVAAFAAFAGVHAVLRESGALEFAASLGSLWMAFSISVLLHEIGHAVGAAAAGLQPFLVIAGGGRSLFLREVAGVAVDLGILPGSGMTLMAGSRLEPWLKWRLLVAYASGPAVSAALLATVLVGFPEQWESFQSSTDRWIGPATALILANGFLLLTSVVPLPRGNDVGSPRNDLTQILMLPWMKPEALALLVKVARAATMTRLFQLRRYQAAFDEGRRRLIEDPTAWEVRLQLADMLIFSRRYSEAATEYAALLDEPALFAKGVPTLAAAFVANNHAWANYMQGGREALDAADSSSSKAISLAPQNPYVLGTRGAVLVAKGEIDKGRELLERARALHRGAYERASNLACLALASAAEGRSAEARAFLERARKLDSDFELRARVERVLARVKSNVDGVTSSLN